MKVEELKNMGSYEVKNFIRQRLMYTQEEIDLVVEHSVDPISYDLLCDIKPNLTLHKRFIMSEDHKSNDDILSKFDDLGLMQCFFIAELTFYKGCRNFVWQRKKFSTRYDENLCGFGTVDIIHFIMCKAWGLNM